MPNHARLSLAARIQCIGLESEAVQQKRNAMLAARGQVELLVANGLVSAARLAHGRYQGSFTNFKPKVDIAPLAQLELAEAIDALDQSLPTLSEKLEACACIEVSTASPPAVAQICSELDDGLARIKSAKKLLAEWRAALADYTRAVSLKERTTVQPVAEQLPPLNPPDPT